MKTLTDPSGALADGLAAIRTEFGVPEAFPPEVEAAASEAAKRTPTDHADWTDRHFVTLDPASSRDLDQAFCIEPAGGDLLLHYAIADVGFFVDPGSPLDTEAWARGLTLYLPDGKAGLYPPVLSEGAASLLPDADKAAVIFHVRIDGAGLSTLDGVTRGLIRSRAKLAYDGAQSGDLPADFAELSKRIVAAELERGAARADPPEQEVESLPSGGYELRFRPRAALEDNNASLSLACNLAVAALLEQHQTGLFRTMPEPWDSARKRLRHTAKALGIAWDKGEPLEEFKRRLNPGTPAEASMLLAIRRASPGAAYSDYDAQRLPWHAAMAAPYLHATAPLRRLGDRYNVEAALALANGEPLPEDVAAAFPRLPKVMARAEQKANSVEKAVIDLAEAVTMRPCVGHAFSAMVTDVDDRGTRVQLCELPVVARVALDGVEPGDRVKLTLTEADLAARALAFAPADG